jgi:hypothetical protein
MKPPAGRKLREGALTDYTLSTLQDSASKLREELKMLVSIAEAFLQKLDAAKEGLELPIGSYNVRGEDEFFD